MNRPSASPGDIDLRRGLPPLQQLALAYAPKDCARRWLALLSLDTRLAGIVRNSREPSLAQLRLAWWREQLALVGSDQRKGDPLLTLLADWASDHAALIALVDGWEAMTEPAPLSAEAIVQLAEGRARAIATLSAEEAGAFQMAKAWALADIAGRLSDPIERATALQLVTNTNWLTVRLSKELKPLKVLHRVTKFGMQREQFGVQINGFTVLHALITGLITR